MTLLVACLLAGAAGCGDDAAGMREWRPEDHGQPPDVVDEPETPVDDTAGGATAEQRAVAALWQASCAGCHGRGGAGDGSDWPEGVDVVDLRDAAWQQGNDDAAVTAEIASGESEGHAFSDRINERGIVALVGHIRSFGPPPEAP